MYLLTYSRTARKQIKKLPSALVPLVIERLESLQIQPRSDGAIQLRGYRNMYRVRQGDYRIIYQIQDTELVVLVIEIGHRREVYRNY